MQDVEVIESKEAAAAALDPVRARLLGELAARYHHDDGRPHRLVVAAHPLPEEST